MKNKALYILALLFATLQTFAQSYTYDNLNRLTKVVYDNGTTITYTFDALGNRTVKKVTGSIVAQYTISVSVTPIGSGSVTGDGTYGSGTNVELFAIANAGYKFSKWSDGLTDNPRIVTVNKNMNFTAQFDENPTAGLRGDIIADGKVNKQDLDALVNAYLNDTKATKVTDLDGDGAITMADITVLVDIINNGNNTYNNNGHQYVDLDLPSGTLWATCNIGATKPEETGDLYAWGETETKTEYTWATYKWCDGDVCNLANPNLTKYCDRGGYGMLDGKITLELDDDVAHVKWGGNWHMPTQEQFQELIDNCTVEWIKMDNSIRAYLFTAANGKTLLMPAAGELNESTYSSNSFEYWSSDLYIAGLPANNHCTNALVMRYRGNNQPEISGYLRYKGYAVRPVLSDYTAKVSQVKAPDSYAGHDLVDLGLPSGTLWATCNLGATSPEGYGCYYSWGETTGSCEGKTSYIESTYKYYNGSSMTKYHEYGDTLESTDDAATVKWSGQWRMPTYSEITELINTKYTTSEWTTINGVSGFKVTSIVKGFEGKSIFLPAAGRYTDKTGRLFDDGSKGYYWGSTLADGSGDYADYYANWIYFNSDRISKGSGPRTAGQTVRPVVSLKAIYK